MNRDFFKPAALILLAAVFTGVLAYLLPSWHNDFFSIRKMPWFEALQAPDPEPEIPVAEPEPVEHAQKALKPFIKKMSSLSVVPEQEAIFPRKGAFSKTEQIRIAYFSDSIIEGDLITAPLRHALQSVYGGIGVGMMPITSIVAGFRQSIRHSFSRNWETISFMDNKNYDVSLGITGYTFIPRPYYNATRTIEKAAVDTLFASDSLVVADSTAIEKATETRQETDRYYVDYKPWVEYKAVDTIGGAPFFENISLFYSHAPDSTYVTVSYDSHSPVTHRLNESAQLQMLDLSVAEPVKSIRLEFNAHKAVRLYGISFAEKSGVYVDNFPIRGYSGLYFQRIHQDILKDFQRKLDYDLVILQYGGNITNPDNTDYSNYKVAMTNTIQHMQDALGDTPILIISVQDRSVKVGTRYQTSPDIPLLVKAQGEVAQETACAFWNLYEAMGGYNSMLEYVGQNPPLAGKDYTHFTRRGADKIAEMLVDFLRSEK
jgi:lysophospholipase L1-like esterase